MKPSRRRFVIHGRAPVSAKPSAWRVACICNASMFDKYFMAFERPVASAVSPDSRRASVPVRKLSLSLCRTYSMNVRCPHSTKAAVSERCATSATVSMASAIVPPMPPSACGTPTPTARLCTSCGSTSVASDGSVSSASAWKSSQSASDSDETQIRFERHRRIRERGHEVGQNAVGRLRFLQERTARLGRAVDGLQG